VADGRSERREHQLRLRDRPRTTLATGLQQHHVAQGQGRRSPRLWQRSGSCREGDGERQGNGDSQEREQFRSVEHHSPRAVRTRPDRREAHRAPHLLTEVQ